MANPRIGGNPVVPAAATNGVQNIGGKGAGVRIQIATQTGEGQYDFGVEGNTAIAQKVMGKINDVIKAYRNRYPDSKRSFELRIKHKGNEIFFEVRQQTLWSSFKHALSKDSKYRNERQNALNYTKELLSAAQIDTSAKGSKAVAAEALKVEAFFNPSTDPTVEAGSQPAALAPAPPSQRLMAATVIHGIEQNANLADHDMARFALKLKRSAVHIGEDGNANVIERGLNLKLSQRPLREYLSPYLLIAQEQAADSVSFYFVTMPNGERFMNRTMPSLPEGLPQTAAMDLLRTALTNAQALATEALPTLRQQFIDGNHVAAFETYRSNQEPNERAAVAQFSTLIDQLQAMPPDPPETDQLGSRELALTLARAYRAEYQMTFNREPSTIADPGSKKPYGALTPAERNARPGVDGFKAASGLLVLALQGADATKAAEIKTSVDDNFEKYADWADQWNLNLVPAQTIRTAIGPNVQNESTRLALEYKAESSATLSRFEAFRAGLVPEQKGFFNNILMKEVRFRAPNGSNETWSREQLVPAHDVKLPRLNSESPALAPLKEAMLGLDQLRKSDGWTGPRVARVLDDAMRRTLSRMSPDGTEMSPERYARLMRNPTAYSKLFEPGEQNVEKPLDFVMRAQKDSGKALLSTDRYAANPALADRELQLRDPLSSNKFAADLTQLVMLEYGVVLGRAASTEEAQRGVAAHAAQVASLRRMLESHDGADVKAVSDFLARSEKTVQDAAAKPPVALPPAPPTGPRFDFDRVVANLKIGTSPSPSDAQALVQRLSDPTMEQTVRAMQARSFLGALTEGMAAKGRDWLGTLPPRMLALAAFIEHEENLGNNQPPGPLEPIIQQTIQSMPSLQLLEEQRDLLDFGRLATGAEMSAALSRFAPREIKISDTLLSISANNTAQVDAVAKEFALEVADHFQDPLAPPLAALVNLENKHWVTVIFSLSPTGLTMSVPDTQPQLALDKGWRDRLRDAVGAAMPRVDVANSTESTTSRDLQSAEAGYALPNACGPLQLLMLRELDNRLSIERAKPNGNKLMLGTRLVESAVEDFMAGASLKTAETARWAVQGQRAVQIEALIEAAQSTGVQEKPEDLARELDAVVYDLKGLVGGRAKYPPTTLTPLDQLVTRLRTSAASSDALGRALTARADFRLKLDSPEAGALALEDMEESLALIDRKLLNSDDLAPSLISTLKEQKKAQESAFRQAATNQGFSDMPDYIATSQRIAMGAARKRTDEHASAGKIKDLESHLADLQKGADALTSKSAGSLRLQGAREIAHARLELALLLARSQPHRKAQAEGLANSALELLDAAEVANARDPWLTVQARAAVPYQREMLENSMRTALLRPNQPLGNGLDLDHAIEALNAHDFDFSEKSDSINQALKKIRTGVGPFALGDGLEQAARALGEIATVLDRLDPYAGKPNSLAPADYDVLRVQQRDFEKVISAEVRKKLPDYVGMVAPKPGSEPAAALKAIDAHLPALLGTDHLARRDAIGSLGRRDHLIGRQNSVEGLANGSASVDALRAQARARYFTAVGLLNENLNSVEGNTLLRSAIDQMNKVLQAPTLSTNMASDIRRELEGFESLARQPSQGMDELRRVRLADLQPLVPDASDAVQQERLTRLAQAGLDLRASVEALRDAASLVGQRDGPPSWEPRPSHWGNARDAAETAFGRLQGQLAKANAAQMGLAREVVDAERERLATTMQGREDALAAQEGRAPVTLAFRLPQALGSGRDLDLRTLATELRWAQMAARATKETLSVQQLKDRERELQKVANAHTTRTPQTLANSKGETSVTKYLSAVLTRAAYGKFLGDIAAKTLTGNEAEQAKSSAQREISAAHALLDALKVSPWTSERERAMLGRVETELERQIASTTPDFTALGELWEHQPLIEAAQEQRVDIAPSLAQYRAAINQLYTTREGRVPDAIELARTARRGFEAQLNGQAGTALGPELRSALADLNSRQERVFLDILKERASISDLALDSTGLKKDEATLAKVMELSKQVADPNANTRQAAFQQLFALLHGQGALVRSKDFWQKPRDIGRIDAADKKDLGYSHPYRSALALGTFAYGKYCSTHLSEMTAFFKARDPGVDGEKLNREAKTILQRAQREFETLTQARFAPTHIRTWASEHLDVTKDLIANEGASITEKLERLAEKGMRGLDMLNH